MNIIQYRTGLIIVPVILQTVITVEMLIIG